MDRVQCDICGWSSATGDDAAMHFAESHSTPPRAHTSKRGLEEDKPVEEGVLRCFLCSYSTANESELTAHIEMHLATSPFPIQLPVRTPTPTLAPVNKRRAVGGLVEAVASVRALLEKNRPASKFFWCASPVGFHSQQAGDAKWGCGYRNLQTVLSHFMGSDRFPALFHGSVDMPSLSQLQEFIVEAWGKGFDPHGAAQLGGEHLIGSTTWIGPSDCAALLRSFRIPARLVDVRWKGSASNDNILFAWVEKWFRQPNAPLMLQWKGHSVSVIGVERSKAGQNHSLIILDPSWSVAEFRKFSQLPGGDVNRFRRVADFLKKKGQVQLLAVGRELISEKEALLGQDMNYHGLRTELSL